MPRPGIGDASLRRRAGRTAARGVLSTERKFRHSPRKSRHDLVQGRSGRHCARQALDESLNRSSCSNNPVVTPPRCGQGQYDRLLEDGELTYMQAARIFLPPLTHLLLAALHEAALNVARAGDQAAARAEVGVTVANLLDGLRSPAAG